MEWTQPGYTLALSSALAEAGDVGYAEKRRETASMEGHLDDVYTGLDALQRHPPVDADRIASMSTWPSLWSKRLRARGSR